MRKYFDQNFKTKFSKQIMAKQTGFQWVVDEMEREFEYPICDVDNFNDFFQLLARYKYHVEYFIRIYEIDKSSLNINNKFLVMLRNIAIYAYKEISLRDIFKDNIYVNFTTLYLLGMIACFVEKSKIVGNYNFGMFIFFNWFELYSIKNMSKKYKNIIEKLLNQLTITEKNKMITIYNRNFNELKTKYNKKNLKKLRKYNYLFQGLEFERKQFCTWQEDYIYKMANLNISISEIIPLWSNRYGKFPDYDLWNEEIIQNMKDFFQNNNNAIMVLEIIDYKLHSKMMSLDTQKFILLNCLKIIKTSKSGNDFNNIWFNLLIKSLNDNKNFIKENSRNIYIELMKKRNCSIILFLKENNFPIGKELQRKIDNFNIRQIKKIEKIEEINIFNAFIKQAYLLNNINLEIIECIIKVFLKLINKFENNMVVSICFYNMVNFLIEAKKKVNSEIVDKHIFKILKLWNEEYYEKMQSLLQVRTYTTQIETKEIKDFNELFLKIPIKILKDNFSWSEDVVLSQMSSISEHAVSAIFKPNTIYLDEFLPYYKKINVQDKESLEFIICEFLDNMQIKYEEQLLNSHMNPREYLYSVYDNYRHNLSSFVCLLNNDVYKHMYNNIKESFTKYKLIDYPEKIEMAHITQLIPLLELLIRELGIKNKVLPFKEKKNQVHVMKDSSTILLTIIKKRYRENKNFDNIEVYMYLYNYLYNVNSLNLRNELIHAREYLENESQMSFAFKVLILGIFWGLIELHI